MCFNEGLEERRAVEWSKGAKWFTSRKLIAMTCVNTAPQRLCWPGCGWSYEAMGLK